MLQSQFFIIFHGKNPPSKNWSQVTLDAGSFLLLPYCLGSGPVAISGGPEACHGIQGISFNKKKRENP